MQGKGTQSWSQSSPTLQHHIVVPLNADCCPHMAHISLTPPKFWDYMHTNFTTDRKTQDFALLSLFPFFPPSPHPHPTSPPTHHLFHLFLLSSSLLLVCCTAGVHMPVADILLSSGCANAWLLSIKTTIRIIWKFLDSIWAKKVTGSVIFSQSIHVTYTVLNLLCPSIL